MPRFSPFPALRYPPGALERVVAPPYDVLSDADLATLRDRDPHNIVHVDVPAGGTDRYDRAAETLRDWVDRGVLQLDDAPTFTIYRMSFTDAAGVEREIAGVLGALEVVDEGAADVLPHERVTPKASTDRLDLTRATRANLSPVWGLSLAGGLSDLLADPAEPVGSVTVDGVTHTVEQLTDPARIAAISTVVAADDVMIADGHHRYGIARTYRDEVRAAGATDSPAELVLAFVNELIAPQLSVEAIHRVYRDVTLERLTERLADGFDLSPSGPVTAATIAEMDERGVLCLVAPGGDGWWLTPKPGFFDGVRALDGAWLEHVLGEAGAGVDYQHGLAELHELLATDPTVAAAILIRPVSLEEIRRTAREGALMPPKSTFFTPKLRTGLVVRPLW